MSTSLLVVVMVTRSGRLNFLNLLNLSCGVVNLSLYSLLFNDHLQLLN